MVVRNALRPPIRILFGKTVFLISAVKLSEKDYSQAGSCVHAGPLAGNAESHTDTAGAQRQKGFDQRSIVKAQRTVTIHKIIH